MRRFKWIHSSRRNLSKHPTSGASVRLCEVECLRPLISSYDEALRISQRAGVLVYPSVKTFVTLAVATSRR
jgi:hypothetical protein